MFRTYLTHQTDIRLFPILFIRYIFYGRFWPVILELGLEVCSQLLAHIQTHIPLKFMILTYRVVGLIFILLRKFGKLQI